jgi:hypothetical protein
MDAAKTCLNIAIDHRIRELFGPVTLPVGSSVPSAQPKTQGFCSITDYINSLRKLDTKEVDVTQRLAGPYGVTRVITVLLKQPRDSHAFDRGMAATVSDCGTLQALHEMFQAATFRTVGISDINIIDAMLFVRPADEKHAPGADKPPFSSETKKKLRFIVRQSLEQIAPSVIMCASQEKLLSDPLVDLISRGVGKSFTGDPNIDIGGHTCCRVNSFHPSSALNYHKLEPELRQLLLLETVQTCQQVGRTWKTDQWMNKLRLSCAKIYSGMSQAYCLPLIRS